MSPRSFRTLIAVVLILFVVVTLALQGICAPDKNPVSGAVSSLIEKSVPEPATQRADPLSYDGIRRVIVRWVSHYCKR